MSPSKDIDSFIEKMKDDNQTPSFLNNDVCGSTWKVVYAPHISILQKLLLTRFTVYYRFLSVKNSIESNVRYESKVFGSGWLNTVGTYTISADKICSLKWVHFWWDLLSEENGPSSVKDVKDHVLPGVIQVIGEKAFIESVSIFPIVFLDTDFCIFDFKLFGTRICSSKIN